MSLLNFTVYLLKMKLENNTLNMDEYGKTN